MHNFLPYAPNCIFLILGHECNASCQYCLQNRVITTNPIPHQKINPAIIKFLKVQSINSIHPVNVQLFGGEPLLFFDTIQKIVESLPGANIHWSMITNGKLLTDDKVAWLNKYNFHVCLSWDGRNSNYTRGYNFFDSEERTNTFLNLENATLSGVLSRTNYPNDFIEDFMVINQLYIDKWNDKFLNCNMDEIFDLGSMQDPTLLHPDYSELRRQSNILCDEYKIKLKNDGSDYNTIKADWVQSSIVAIKNAVHEYNDEFYIARCGNGYSVLNMDLEGNLYRCHNSNEKIGDIYSSVLELFKKTIKSDPTKYRQQNICNTCTVQTYCMNGCPIITDEVLTNSYCEFFRALYEPIYECIFSEAEKITSAMVGTTENNYENS